jgi:hypothetical protein
VKDKLNYCDVKNCTQKCHVKHDKDGNKKNFKKCQFHVLYYANNSKKYKATDKGKVAVSKSSAKNNPKNSPKNSPKYSPKYSAKTSAKHSEKLKQ